MHYVPSLAFTAAQLYSTASYLARDLSRVNFGGKGGCYGGNDLTGWNFAGQNLTDAGFSGDRLTNADFTGAVVQGACFSETLGFTADQLYSTASYQARDLSGIGLEGNLIGWNFAGQNLTNADLGGRLVNADLRGADIRGASLYYEWWIAILGNTIMQDGHIEGLDLDADQTLVVRDYDGKPDWPSDRPPIPIVVQDRFTMDPGGVLKMLFEADTWDSTISFEPGIPVTIAGGILDLQLAAGVVPASQIGRTLQLFNWTGVAPTGQFHIVSPYVWDSSRLYSTGEITFVGVPETPSLTLMTLGISSLLFRRPSRLCRLVKRLQGRSKGRKESHKYQQS